jgi:hypothetical protein
VCPPRVSLRLHSKHTHTEDPVDMPLSAGWLAGWLDGWMGCRSLGVTTHLVIRSRSDATCTSNLLCRQQTFCPLRPTKGKVVARLLLPSALFAHIVFAHPLDVANSPNRVLLTHTLISNTRKILVFVCFGLNIKSFLRLMLRPSLRS